MPDDQQKFLVAISTPERMRQQAGAAAVLLMVAAILFPAVRYSVGLQNPTPEQLIVAICIAVFSSTVCFWLLDAIGIIKFENKTLRNSIWTAAIVSILGTSVGVYRGAFSERKYPQEGGWNLRLTFLPTSQTIAECSVVLIYSETGGYYWGYSNLSPPNSFAATQESGPEHIFWIEVTEFASDSGRISLRLFGAGGQEIQTIDASIKQDASGHLFETSEGSGGNYRVSLTRSH